ncbi:unnamed protein product [Effrenium voratum]|nr:unnamed protein product [Effrenium voratum]
MLRTSLRVSRRTKLALVRRRSSTSYGALAACARSARWQLAISHLEVLCKRGQAARPEHHVPVEAYNAVISACKQRKQWAVVLRLVELMQRRACEPDQYTYSSAISSCGGAHWQHALALGEQMVKEAVEPGAVAATALISACARAAEWQLALNLYEKKRWDAAAVVNATMNACVRGSCWPLSLQLLQRMVKDGLQPDLVSFNSAIHACEKGGAWVLALQLLARLEEALQPDVISFNAAMSACSEGQRWAGALLLLSEMATKQVIPDLVSFNAALKASKAAQLWPLSFQLLGQMMACKLRPNLISFNTVLAACERWEHSVQVLQSLRRSQLQPDRHSWTSLVAAYARDSKWMQARSALRDARCQRLQPDLVSFGAAASACRSQWRLALALFAELQDASLQPDERFCGSVITASALGMQWKVATSLLLEMPIRRLEPSAASAAPVLSVLLDAKQWQRALELFGQLPDHAKDVQSYSQLVMLCEQRDRPERQEMLESLAASKGVSRSLAAVLGSTFSRSREEAFVPLSAASAWRPYVKEIRLMQHVLQNAQEGDPQSVCDAVEGFGLHAKGKAWLKVAAGQKAEVLVAAARAAAAGSMLEIGTYCGHSAIRLAAARPDMKVVSLEMDPIHAVLARRLVAFAGLAESIQVWTGHSRDLLPYLAEKYAGFDFVFMDQRGSRYEEDLASLERLGLLQPGALVVADNVLKPGAPVFLWRVCKAQDYETQAALVASGVRQLEVLKSATSRHPALSGEDLLPCRALPLLDTATDH